MRMIVSQWLLWLSTVSFQQAESKNFAFVPTPSRHQNSAQNFHVESAFAQQPSLLRPSLRHSNVRLSSVSSTDTSKTENISFKLNPSISVIPAEAWDSCLNEHSSPFLQHAWIRCLEESKCASPTTGWVPQHLSITIDGKVRGYLPLYLKSHSMGEFIFDQPWASAAEDNGINYYPKLLVGIPFTPVTGQRILLDPDLGYTREQVAEVRRAVGDFLKQVAFANKISSVHLNFITDEEATDLSRALEKPNDSNDKQQSGSSITKSVKAMLSRQLSKKDTYLRRTSLQYHWTNRNAKNEGKPYETFEEYLGCFKSKRRITIRRERQKVQQDEGIRVDAVTGEDILEHEGLVERMFEIYVSTVERLYWGRQYLSLEFFQLLCESDFVKNLCFMCARLKSTGAELKASDVFAGTINIVKDGVFYGRYWGCLAGKEVKNLHFETCYWRAIEYCIQNGLQRMEPGAGGADYKWARGFDPALIHSVHYICNKSLQRAIKQFLDYETESNVELTDYLLLRSVVGNRGRRAASA